MYGTTNNTDNIKHREKKNCVIMWNEDIFLIFYHWLLDTLRVSQFSSNKSWVGKRLEFRQRDSPDCQIFTTLYQNLCEYGSLGNSHNENGPRVAQTPNSEQSVLKTVRRKPRTSVWVVAAAIRGLWITVYRVSQSEVLYAYHLWEILKTWDHKTLIINSHFVS